MNERLSRDEVKELTAEVKRDAQKLWMKLLRLHEGKAHEVLGYSSWDEACGAEFGYERAHAYRLVAAGACSATSRVSTWVPRGCTKHTPASFTG